VLNRPMAISRSAQTCALGSAIAGALVAGAHPGIESAIDAMTGVREKVFRPIPEHVSIYQELYRIYKTLHDAFGISGTVPVDRVMKNLLAIKERVVTG